MLIDQGGSIIIRNTNALRARTPSSRPTTASTPEAYPARALTGAMTIAAAVGVRRALGPGRLSAWAAGLLGAYGACLVAAGIFRADPSDGFPPGTPPGMGEVSWHGLAHFAVAGIGFAGLVAACFVLGTWFARNGMASWAWFSRITGVVFAGSFMALSSGSGGATTILAFTAAVALVCAWLTAVSVKLYRGVEPA